MTALYTTLKQVFILRMIKLLTASITSAFQKK